MRQLNDYEIRRIVADEVKRHLGGLYNDVLPKTVKDATGRLLTDIKQEVEQTVINLKQDITNYITKLEQKVKEIEDKQTELEQPQEPTDTGGLPFGAFKSNLIRNGAFINYIKKADTVTSTLANVAELPYWNNELASDVYVQIGDMGGQYDKWGFGSTFLILGRYNGDETKGLLYQDIEIPKLNDNILMAFSCLAGTWNSTWGWFKTPKVVIECYDKDDNLLTSEEITLTVNNNYWTDPNEPFWTRNFHTFEAWAETERIRVKIVGDGCYDALMLWSGDKDKPFELNPADMVDGVDDELERIANLVQWQSLQVDISDLRQTAKQYMTQDEWRDLFENDVTILKAKAFRIVTDKIQIGDQTLQTQIDINAVGIETLVSNSANYLYVGDNNGDYVKNADGSFSYVGWVSTWAGGYEPPDSNGQGNGDYILSSGSHSRITQLSDRIVLAVDNAGKIATLALGSNTFGSVVSIDADQINITGTTAFIGSDLSTATIDGGAIEADTVIARVGISGSCLEINSTDPQINHPTYGLITPMAVFGASLDPNDTDDTRLTIDQLGRIWSGSRGFSDAKFKVDEYGNLEAQDATLYGALWIKPTSATPTYPLWLKFVSDNSSTTEDWGLYIMGQYYTIPEQSPSYTRITDTLVKSSIGDFDEVRAATASFKVYTYNQPGTWDDGLGWFGVGCSEFVCGVLFINENSVSSYGRGMLKVENGDLIYVDPAGNSYVIQTGVAVAGTNPCAGSGTY